MRFQHLRVIIVSFVASAHSVRAAYKWSSCEDRVRKIQAGELVIRNIDNITIANYIYHDPVAGLSPNVRRQDYLTLTYEGCKAICGDPIAFYDAPEALSLATNWLFPLAILLSLPWESLHERKLSKTLVAVLNWLGSPQMSLTATIFNFRQFREAHRRVLREVNGGTAHLHSAAYFVLCSLNQFDGLRLVAQSQTAQGGAPARPTRALGVLVYGLFRPMSGEQQDDDDVQLTEQLLLALAFELRMLRRRGVIPMLANLGTFLVAFIFSVVLAFAELDNGNTPFPLAFGLLVTWVPLLVVFTIVDRNPVSSERTAVLFSRWLHNVEAVRTWAATHPRNHIDAIPWWNTATVVHEDLRVDEFIGQGRKIQFCGLPHALLRATDSVDFHRETRASLKTRAEEIAQVLDRGKPRAWYVVAVLSFLLVWTAVMSAFVVSFNMPTVGLGCRSLTYLLFGVFGSVSWVIQFWSQPARWARLVSYLCNTLAILTISLVVLFQVTGLASNCICKCSIFSMPLLGGYTDFKDAGFYRDNFNVMEYWAGAAHVGGSVPTVAFVVALFWWLKCRHLWKANERGVQNRMYRVYASTTWLGQ